jgi:hypothetical protein
MGGGVVELLCDYVELNSYKKVEIEKRSKGITTKKRKLSNIALH